MIDMANTIIPKSDQQNADDYISGPRTIIITKVSANEGSAEQPISVWFEGDNGKPWKPCKSSRRVLVTVWGRDAASYVGRSLTLFRDPSVTWAGMAVGGIRISHMSNIDEPVTMALTASKQVRKPFTVRPLDVAAKQTKREKSPIDVYAQDLGEVLKAAATTGDVDGLSLFWANTGERRMALNIPDDRLEKMRLAVDKILNPDAQA
jgi:hypothetical protein